jgi:hypothetical protein
MMRNTKAGNENYGFLKAGFHRPFLSDFFLNPLQKVLHENESWEKWGWQYWENSPSRLQKEAKTLRAFLVGLKPQGKLDFNSVSVGFSENRGGQLAITFYVEKDKLVLYKVFVDPSQTKWSLSCPIYDETAWIVIRYEKMIVGTQKDVLSWLNEPF